MIQHNDIIQGTDGWHHLKKEKVTRYNLKAIMGTKNARRAFMNTDSRKD